MKLSILICSLNSRHDLLDRLHRRLKPQTNSAVEILVYPDNGEITTGKKRNELLQSAIGDYIAFVDDDDLVSPDYVSKILRALESKPDCCSLQGEIEMTIKQQKGSQRVKRLFKHSLQYKSWYTENDVYYRCPNHLNAVRRDLASAIGFPDVTVGEDKNYSERLLKVLKTEVPISGTIYYYYAG